MNASLVYDGTLRVPDSMGLPRADQLKGSNSEKLGEVASRICYDSLGTGRTSEQLHEHIVHVINLSVYEHFNFTVSLNIGEQFVPYLMRACINRKGIWFKNEEDSNLVQITANFRAILEWDRHTRETNECFFNNVHTTLGSVLYRYAQRQAPMIFKPVSPESGDMKMFLENSCMNQDEDLDEDQIWITLWLYGSRGFTHEQVRHRFAMSQRSTRYVDESESPWIEHPLITKYLGDYKVSVARKKLMREGMNETISKARSTYDMIAAYLTEYLTGSGMDKTNARKQARGSARGYLGNALASEMVFSAPITGWKWILKQRASKFADAEIRAIYTPGLEALKSSRFGHYFNEFTLVDSPDGLGKVLT